jgi:hypothetical protein
MSHTAYIVYEPGFAHPEQLGISLEKLNYEVKVGPLSAIPECDVVIMRGPWIPTSEEKLFSKILSKVFATAASKLANTKTRFLGIGRGALIILFSDALKFTAEDWDWDKAEGSPGPWIKTTIDGVPQSLFHSLLFSKIHPSIESLIKTPLKSWLKTEICDVGWRSSDNRILLSLVDPCALLDPAQLPDFGYADLSNVKTQAAILDLLLRES